MQVIGAGYVGDFLPGRVVNCPVRTTDAQGASVSWSGLAYVQRSDGSFSEEGVGSHEPAVPDGY